MTRKEIMSANDSLVSNLPTGYCILGVGAHLYNGMLIPGITYKDAIDQDYMPLLTNTVCWVPDKQLTVKQMLKVLTIWNDSMLNQ